MHGLLRRTSTSVRPPTPQAVQTIFVEEPKSAQEYTVHHESDRQDCRGWIPNRRMKEPTMKQLVAAGSWVLLASMLGAQQPHGSALKLRTPEALQAEIEALKPGKVAWREIAWKSCLLEGLKESRAQGKPVLLWV